MTIRDVECLGPWKTIVHRKYQLLKMNVRDFDVIIGAVEQWRPMKKRLMLDGNTVDWMLSSVLPSVERRIYTSDESLLVSLHPLRCTRTVVN